MKWTTISRGAREERRAFVFYTVQCHSLKFLVPFGVNRYWRESGYEAPSGGSRVDLAGGKKINNDVKVIHRVRLWRAPPRYSLKTETLVDTGANMIDLASGNGRHQVKTKIEKKWLFNSVPSDNDRSDRNIKKKKGNNRRLISYVVPFNVRCDVKK